MTHFASLAEKLNELGIIIEEKENLTTDSQNGLRKLEKPHKISDQNDLYTYTNPFNESIWHEKTKIEVIQPNEFAELEEDNDDDDEEEGEEEGGCLMCHRVMPLTRHHLIPRTLHQNYRKTHTQEQLNTCILICRPCHSAIHKFIDEKTMGKSWNTLEKLLEHEAVQKWIPYISKQKVRLKGSNEKNF